jgi:hypothetical protein
MIFYSLTLKSEAQGDFLNRPGLRHHLTGSQRNIEVFVPIIVHYKTKRFRYNDGCEDNHLKILARSVGEPFIRGIIPCKTIHFKNLLNRKYHG